MNLPRRRVYQHGIHLKYQKILKQAGIIYPGLPKHKKYKNYSILTYPREKQTDAQRACAQGYSQHRIDRVLDISQPAVSTGQ